MIRLVHQFDPPGVLAAAAPQSCGGCSCCSCCCCIVTTLAASVITARSLGRPFVGGAPPPAESAAAAPAEARARRAGFRARALAFLLLPASIALAVLAAWAGQLDLDHAVFVAPAAWALGLAALAATRRLPVRTAVAVFVLGLAAFAAEFFVWLRLVVPQ